MWACVRARAGVMVRRILRRMGPPFRVPDVLLEVSEHAERTGGVASRDRDRHRSPAQCGFLPHSAGIAAGQNHGELRCPGYLSPLLRERDRPARHVDYLFRSEKRRVGKEWRSWWSPYP